MYKKSRSENFKIMIIGMGCDIIEISRIKKAMENPTFVKRCFTEGEREYISVRQPESAAAIFAAKEAYSKALGTGFDGFYFDDIEVFHDKNGKPYIKGYNAAEVSDCGILLTISHCKEYAMAVVVIEKR